MIKYGITILSNQQRVLMSEKWIEDTEYDANNHLEFVLYNNTPSKIESIFGKGSYKTIEVTPIDCYDNGQPKSLIFDN